ncbi:glycosyltransferase [Fimbriimonas ginsengisoli]|uniref:Glycosyl transferase family 2 n=1 Tax=Fimbriimonas ginsengisoli Gsoil 348 TaxID=661478 RepID=A0A068NYY7_FIMGI|nr:glycosyltransferase [Fimbriimonas ginsengisoli]AIE87644.1 glycosyl transferase family 2 [Fimbriimonas ginsengisoli Gsoil 348]
MAVASPAGQIVAAFYAPWQEAGLNSLRAYGKNLTHLIPAWLHLNAAGELDTSDFDLDQNPLNSQVIASARDQGVRIMPLLSNSRSDSFDPKSAGILLQSAERQQAMSEQLRDWLVSNRFQGLNIDFENLKDVDQARLPGFLALLSRTLKADGLELTVSVDADTDPDVVKEMVPACDWLVLMAYDEHAETTGAGPIASIDWAEKVLDKTLKVVPADKLVLGIGSYAYDWQKGQAAQSISYQEALSIAAGYRDGEKPADVIDFDPNSLNSTFEYADDDGKTHEIWMLDAGSAFNQWSDARDLGLRGASVWALGMEDPGLWSFLNRRSPERAPQVSAMTQVSFPYGVDHVGKGEILKVLQHPTVGQREFEVDKETGLVTDMNYLRYPFPYVIQHSGYNAATKMKLALTFDDGPDGEYTGPILDELKRLGVKATFFVVGRNVEARPDLLRRIYAEGHEVGSHTFFHPDLGMVSPRRAALELNATQRSIQSVIGHSTTLFRPPFNADSEPQAPAEVEPVNIADRMGYVTVGEKVDPQDWNLDVPTGHGATRTKTADDIATSIIHAVHTDADKHEEGNIILLHDAGGPRDATVAALRKFVPELESEGYQFVAVSQLMGKTRDEVMPGLTTGDRLAIWFDGLVLSSVFRVDSLLASGFVLAIGLGLLRILFVVPLALRHRKAQSLLTFDDAYQPKVAVLIAAFNEEKVIRRTVESALASAYPSVQVIVVDDGSTDGTYAAVAELESPHVLVVHQENGGKASALNHALHLTDAEVVLCIDADTQIHPKAMARLVRHFRDPKVAAVAGNVRVGNVHNILTEWQAMEYTTTQNLDRSAYAQLNAITVVPGAIGAWRREAVLAVGGYTTDTLAEDMDLTWRLRRAEYRLDTDPTALAYTEAPDTFRSFFKQRFRWTFGTLQCLFKHRRALGRHGWFGALALPTLWLFQVVFQGLAPLVDIQVVYSLIAWVASRFGDSGESAHTAAAGATAALIQVLALYALFFGVELFSGFLAYRLEKQSTRPLRWLFLQRCAYRQVMYGVVYRSLVRALAGRREGWGKLERKGTVTVSS